ncbi:substrate-binding domain-containing protein [Agreia sp. COWG]|uniref:substrate-binding domain-containing protein n=1 Tax=Agreia sp. COWG TaxID=2773266 RepID=UPI001926CA15|nr:substrate-binding domain-containing protein [Agreia sp. COWG]CAD5990675.1 Phosphate ABC transporter, phosphate-binding protein [Agreia sp. COWG]
MTSTKRTRRPIVTLLGAVVGLTLILTGSLSASAASYTRISGQGSSWAGNAVAEWVSQVRTQGVTVDYTAAGSSSGRANFANQTNADFAVSEIPYTGDTADPQDSNKPSFGYGMLPVVAGGTSFMYNLQVGGQRFTDLKLSPGSVAGIFSGAITRWNAPEIVADNPDVALPDQRITVVVRSDGSGATAQFKLWMLRQFPAQYAALAAATGMDAAHASSYFPTGSLSNFVAQNQSQGVTQYTSDTPGTINYDEYSYAQQVGFPVAQLKNAAGFYTVPDQYAVAVALTQAQINQEAGPNYLSQDLSNVYQYGDPRSYPLSAYSYMLVPTELRGGFTADKGATLAYFNQYALCEGQRTMGALGYSPLPMNLILAAMEQVAKIPGIDEATLATITATRDGVLHGGANPCNSPTFQPGDDVSHNVLIDTAPFPAGCDAACQAPWRLAGSGVGVGGPTFETDATAVAGGGSGAPAATDNAAAAGGPANAGTTAAKSCDADTGVCASDDATLAGANVKAIPTVIGGQQGWAGPQTLMTLVGLLLVTLLLAPPLVGRILSRSSRPSRSSSGAKQ